MNITFGELGLSTLHKDALLTLSHNILRSNRIIHTQTMQSSPTLLLSLIHLTSSLTLAAPQSPQQSNIRTLYQFPQKPTWLGSLVVRPTGPLLATLFTKPDLFTLDPSAPQPEPKLVHSFPGAQGLTGITEATPDVYQLIAGNFSSKTEASVPGTLKMWSVDYSHGRKDPVVKQSADLGDVQLINGLASLNPVLVLGSDSINGSVYRINVRTGAHSIAIADPLMSNKPPFGKASSGLGVNGIKIVKEGCKTYLYFSNTAKSLLGKVQISEQDGSPMGPAEVVKGATTPLAAKGVGYDDFALRRGGDGGLTAYLCDSRGNSIAKVGLDGEDHSPKIIAGSATTTQVAEPEAAAFGRTKEDCDVLYVVTAGGAGDKGAGQEVVGGQFLALDVKR